MEYVYIHIHFYILFYYGFLQNIACSFLVQGVLMVCGGVASSSLGGLKMVCGGVASSSLGGLKKAFMKNQH